MCNRAAGVHRNGYLKRHVESKEHGVVKRMKMEHQGQAGVCTAGHDIGHAAIKSGPCFWQLAAVNAYDSILPCRLVACAGVQAQTSLLTF